jgi:hypothetical protein
MKLDTIGQIITDGAMAALTFLLLMSERRLKAIPPLGSILTGVAREKAEKDREEQRQRVFKNDGRVLLLAFLGFLLGLILKVSSCVIEDINPPQSPGTHSVMTTVGSRDSTQNP